MAEEKHIKLKGKIEELSELKKGSDELWWITGAIVHEAFGTLSEMTVEFVTGARIELKKLVGQPMQVEVEDKLSQKKRYFSGICVSLECIGQVTSDDGLRYHHVAKVRHWLWLLTRTTNNRIFQDKTAVQIIEQVFGDHGFSDFEKKLRETYEPRTYCVQYRETDFDFVSRLMQEEGIYYFFDNAPDKGTANKLILCDDASSSHATNPAKSSLEFTSSGGREAEAGDTVTDWTRSENVIPGLVTLTDYDMLTPKSDLKVSEKTVTKSEHGYADMELYHYPGKYRKDTARGKRHARVRMEAEEVEFQTRKGASNARSIATGYQFNLTGADSENAKYLVIAATHYIRPTESMKIDPGRLDRDREDLKYPKELDSKTDYVCYFSAIPEKTQFRSRQTVEWPEIPGLHTAIVTGKSGEEIWTDEHGRIKVQFHWDRVGKKDENSSCWVRVASPWSGKDWGMVAIPRMGQEVIIQFEEGDPDRPICMGMLWNEDTKPAWGYPDNAAQFGMRSRSTKGGGATNYNEVMFEDKKGSENMRMQAEKDHQWLIKNKSVTTIGYDELDAGAHDADGCLSEVIKKDVTRTIKEGNHYHTIAKGDEEYKIETGSQTIEIKTDKTQTVEGKYTETITGDMTTEVKTGNQANTVKMGNQTTEVKMGNISTKAALGKIEVEAMQSIELKVGGSSIKIDQMGVTIKGMMIKVEGSIMTEVKGLMTTVKADAILTAKGSITMIN